jgi:hypothetical protein
MAKKKVAPTVSKEEVKPPVAVDQSFEARAKRKQAAADKQALAK